MQKINISDEVRIWVHWKYGNSGILRIKRHKNNCSYLADLDYDWLNRKKNETYNLQLKNS